MSSTSSSLAVALNEDKPRISLARANALSRQIAQSTAGRESKDIETALTRLYARIFVNLIKPDPNYPTNLDEVKRKYNQLVYDISRTAIQLTYTLGAQYVAKNEQSEPYLTHDDITNIENITDETVNSFWRKIKIDIDRKLENEQLQQEGKELKPDLKIISFLQLSAINAISVTLSKATITKLQQIKQSGSRTSGNILLKTASTLEESDVKDKDDSEESIESTALADLGLQKAGILHSALLLGTILEQAKKRGITTKAALANRKLIVWITRQDERVCPICLPLHGMVFEVDDPFLPSPGTLGPGVPTHNRCRCRTLEILADGSIPA